jgi:hypothetical protein
MDHLERRGHHQRRLALYTEEARGFEHEEGPHALAPRERGMAHRQDKPFRPPARCKPQPEFIVDKMLRSSELLLEIRPAHSDLSAR